MKIANDSLCNYIGATALAACGLRLIAVGLNEVRRLRFVRAALDSSDQGKYSVVHGVLHAKMSIETRSIRFSSSPELANEIRHFIHAHFSFFSLYFTLVGIFDYPQTIKVNSSLLAPGNSLSTIPAQATGRFKGKSHHWGYEPI